MKRKPEIYDSAKWSRLRASVLRRDQYRDMVRHRYGKNVPAELVHHVFPLEEFPEYAWESWNLISVSRATHNRLHDRNTDDLTELGKDLLRRTARKNGVEIPMKYQEEKKTSGWKPGNRRG